MKKLSFEDAENYSVITKYEIKEISSKENLPNHILDDVQISLKESDKREVVSSELVHKQMEKYVQHCLDK